MPLKDSSLPEVRTLMTGLMFGESPRWRDGRFWVSDWVAHEVIAVDLEGKSEVVVREPSIPLCFDFLPDGRLVIMSGRRILRLEPDGSLAVLQTINLDRGCFACMLGGTDRRTLLLVATEWRGPAGMTDGRRTGQVLTVEAPAPGVGWP